MRRLIHLPLSPSCRFIRLAMAEKELDIDLVVEKAWLRRPPFLALNPAGTLPVLVESDGRVVCEALAIAEYLEESYPDKPLLPPAAVDRAEVRRLVLWFEHKFHQEVSGLLLGEKVDKRLQGLGTPDSGLIRAGLENIRHHLDYIAYLAERRNWLAGDELSLADLAAAAHLSSVDYLGNVPWDHAEPARIWYARLKSRKCFRSILGDHVPGIRAAAHYADLDF